MELRWFLEWIKLDLIWTKSSGLYFNNQNSLDLLILTISSLLVEQQVRLMQHQSKLNYNTFLEYNHTPAPTWQGILGNDNELFSYLVSWKISK